MAMNEAYEHAKKSDFYKCKTCRGKKTICNYEHSEGMDFCLKCMPCPTCKGTGIHIESETQYMHILSECSEAFQAYRKGKLAPDGFIHSFYKDTTISNLWKYSFNKFLKGTFEMELGDIYIIIQSTLGYYNLSINESTLKLRKYDVPEDKETFINSCLLDIEKSIIKSSYHKDREEYLADAIATLFSLAAALEIPLLKYVEVKMRYNTTRAKLHEEKENA